MTKVYQGLSLNDLKTLIKTEIREVTLNDLYELSYYFNEETTYLPNEYKKSYIESIQNVIVNRFTLLKNDQKDYDGFLNEKNAMIINKLLESNDNVIKYILNIIVIYKTYFLKEPIHLPKTEFPGKVSVYKEGSDYYCPIKKYHMNDENALCKICIAKNTKEE